MSNPRAFDHDEAARRRADGESWVSIAHDFGVTPSAVSIAVRRIDDPEFRARLRDYARERQRDRLRQPCIRGCGGLAWKGPGLSGVCQACFNADRVACSRTSRVDALRCSECGEWKPDEAFPHHAGSVARRGRHSVCRDCSPRVRQRSRLRRSVPCVRCGTPRLDPKDVGTRFATTGLCRTCYSETRQPR